MTQRDTQSGFSAVELLISLFIAVAFIAAGYQLYAVVIKDGADARYRAEASNIAYAKLRLYAAQATNPCTEVTPSPTPELPADTLPNGDITADITCPYGIGNPTSKVVVAVQYGSPQHKVVHALYVTN